MEIALRTNDLKLDRLFFWRNETDMRGDAQWWLELNRISTIFLLKSSLFWINGVTETSSILLGDIKSWECPSVNLNSNWSAITLNAVSLEISLEACSDGFIASIALFKVVPSPFEKDIYCRQHPKALYSRSSGSLLSSQWNVSESWIYVQQITCLMPF